MVSYCKQILLMQINNEVWLYLVTQYSDKIGLKNVANGYPIEKIEQSFQCDFDQLWFLGTS